MRCRVCCIAIYQPSHLSLVICVPIITSPGRFRIHTCAGYLGYPPETLVAVGIATGIPIEDVMEFEYAPHGFSPLTLPVIAPPLPDVFVHENGIRLEIVRPLVRHI